MYESAVVGIPKFILLSFCVDMMTIQTALNEKLFALLDISEKSNR